MNIVKAELRTDQYYQGVYQKMNIVLHHTVSSTASSALTWWKMTPDRVGTAFVIDKDGTIYQAFDPKFWAHHLGLKTNRNLELNRRSIGIEIVNEGPLKVVDDKAYWNFSPGKLGARYQGERVQHPWRGYECWAKYTPAQYAALNELIPALLAQFNLKPTVYTGMDFNPVAPDRATIYSHRNVRQDKSDLSPAFDFELLTCLKPSVLV